jgi:hypothetical protein
VRLKRFEDHNHAVFAIENYRFSPLLTNFGRTTASLPKPQRLQINQTLLKYTIVQVINEHILVGFSYVSDNLQQLNLSFFQTSFGASSQYSSQNLQSLLNSRKLSG